MSRSNFACLLVGALVVCGCASGKPATDSDAGDAPTCDSYTVEATDP